MKNYILALDEGTTGARAILFDENERVVARAYREIGCAHPKPAYVEQDAEEIFAAQFSVAAEVIARADVPPAEIAAIGITNQRETTVVWEKTSGKPICPAIVWQCRRTADYCEKLKEEGLSEMLRGKTGLLPDAYFSATKLRWILDHVEGARERAQRGELLFGTVDSFLIYRLTGGRVHATDRTNASRTMLYNLHDLCFDKELLDLFGIPEAMLPQVLPSAAYYGECRLLGGSIPICGVAGDQQAALFGQGCFAKGQVKNTYGTGCFMLMHTGNEAICPKGGLLTTLAATDGKSVAYALEGSIFTAGAVIKWLRDELHLIENAAQTEELARGIPDNGGVYLVPAFTGLGAPYWDTYARGAIVGLSAGCGRAQIVRAALECMAYRTNELVTMMAHDAGTDFAELRVDGGATQNDFLMQFQADILGVPVIRPKNVDLTALGAARLAATHVGLFLQDDCERDREARVFLPGMDAAVRKKNLDGWQKAVRSVRSE